MIHASRRRAALLGCALLLLGACRDRGGPLTPDVTPEPQALAAIECSVAVRPQTITCVPSQSSAPGIRADRIFGGQGTYMKLASSGTVYNSGTQRLESDVTVQNLIQQAIGTTDGTTVAPTGVRVFFHDGPTVTSGSGVVTLVNPDGTETYLGSGREYYQYDEILTPYEISAAKHWIFSVPTTVNTFTFTLYVNATVQDQDLRALDLVWYGSTGTDWQTAGNWNLGAVPDDSSTVSILADSVQGGNMPVLSADAQVMNLMVGSGTTLNLNTHTLEAGGNVVAVGTMSGGTLRMTGAGTVLQGNVPAVEVTGSTSLQGGTTASGAVAVSGALTLPGQVLTISAP